MRGEVNKPRRAALHLASSYNFKQLQTVIASVSEAIQHLAASKVWIASSLALLAMTQICIPAARKAPE